MSCISIKHLALILAVSGVSLGILTACNQDDRETEMMTSGPLAEPNIILDVKTEMAEQCPKTVGIWTFLLPFEGGAEHTAVADIRNAKLIASGKNFVEYEAPLRQTYASCVGSAKSEIPPVYNFRLQNGKVYFRLDLNQATLNTTITYQGTGGFRPYVRWIAEE
ncbi:hypothetical protein LC593_09895 [Nostoc sp. CHAB 5844]|nr:hypothetical protein [Nostoc sp. CHAB 5844]